MKQARQDKIDAGKVWQIYPSNDPDNVLFEGTKSQCIAYKKKAKDSNLSIGKLIWEADSK